MGKDNNLSEEINQEPVTLVEFKDLNPKHLIVQQDVDFMEDMTEGQLADYLAENFSDYNDSDC